MVSLLHRIDRALDRLESFMAIALLAFMVGLAFLQVVLRNIGHGAFPWADSLLRLLVLWLAFFGASFATRQGRHIRVDIFAQFWPESWRKPLKTVAHLGSSVVCLLLVRASIVFVQIEHQAGSTALESIPAWIFQMILPIGFGLLAIRFILRAFLLEGQASS